MSIQLSGTTREKLLVLWENRKKEIEASRMSSIVRKPAIFDHDRILAFAIGKPSEAYGEPYKIFDSGRIIARLPGPPYQVLDRITEIHAEPWKNRSSAHSRGPRDPGRHAHLQWLPGATLLRFDDRQAGCPR